MEPSAGFGPATITLPTEVNVDWDAFSVWVHKKGFTEKYEYSVLWSAKKYAYSLFTGNFRDVDAFGLKGLANLAKFLNWYPLFQRLKSDAGLHWESSSSEDVFLKIYYGEETTGMLEWLDSVKSKFGREVWFPIVFMLLSGLRTSEAITVLNLIAEHGLEAYPMNKEKGVLEHFKVKDSNGKPLFLRRTKKAFLTVYTDRLLQELNNWHTQTSYDSLRKKLERQGIPIRFYDCRRWFATTLRETVDSEMIDLLSGRLPKKIFIRSYWRPELSKHFLNIKHFLMRQESKLYT